MVDNTNIMQQKFQLRGSNAEDSVSSTPFLSTHWISVMSRIKDDKKKKLNTKWLARDEAALLAWISC